MDLSVLLEPAILTEVLLQGFVRGSMYALMATGLSLIFGIMGVANFAHGELFMIGTYVMVLVGVVLGLPFVLGMIAAVIALFLIGTAIERGLIEPLRRRAGREWLIDVFVLTIGLSVVLQNLALIAFGSRRQGITRMVDGNLVMGSIAISYDRLLILAVATLAVALLWAFIKFSSLGKAIRATSQDPDAAQTLGIDVGRVYTMTFGIGAAFAGLAGALLISIFPAYPTVGMQPVLKAFAVIILGGLGSVPGAIAGGLLLGVIEAYTFFFMSAGWQNVLTALLVILILIVMPSGLFGAARWERP
jgi:branched-chain amino acid transport system permease protein